MEDQQLRRDDHGSGSRGGFDLGLHDGAGDGNRTRTVSLGSGTVPAARGADLLTVETRSTRDWPLITLVNGTLMARRSWAPVGRMGQLRLLVLPRPPHSCRPLAVAAGSRLTK
jgi:hypothetical protein